MSERKYTAEMAHAAVARGAAWLDKRCPDWPREIDTHLLNLSNPEICILGQTATCLLPESAPAFGYADYNDVVNHFAPIAALKWARRYGFDVPDMIGASYEMLTIAWKEQIRQRLEVRA